MEKEVIGALAFTATMQFAAKHHATCADPELFQHPLDIQPACSFAEAMNLVQMSRSESDFFSIAPISIQGGGAAKCWYSEVLQWWSMYIVWR
nr:hypothetical protein [Pseudomonas fluorescens]